MFHGWLSQLSDLAWWNGSSQVRSPLAGVRAGGLGVRGGADRHRQRHQSYGRRRPNSTAIDSHRLSHLTTETRRALNAL